MKRLILGSMLWLILASLCQAQNLYSEQNLSGASVDSLELLYSKALKLKKAGVIKTGIGPVLSVGGFYLVVLGSMEDSDLAILAGITSGLVGGVLFIAGIPQIIVGVKRVRRIRPYMQGINQTSSINITPCTINYNKGNQVCPGIKLTINF